MKRGEIYYISRRGAQTVGAELMKSRPAVIVSNNALNETAEVVEVVYLSTSPKKDLPTHVCLHATGVPSTALCEQIDHVSLRLVGDYCGTCTEEEMAAIDQALLRSLGIAEPALDIKEATKVTAEETRLREHLRAVVAERDRYAKMVDLLLGCAE